MNDVTTSWRTYHLGELAKYVNGRAFKPDDWSNSGRPIIRIQNLTDPSKPFNHFEGEVDNTHIVRNGDHLIAWSATLGSFIWNRGEAVLNQHIFKVSPNPSIIDPQFFHFLMLSVLDAIADQAHGLAMKHITKTKFEAFETRVPGLVEQRRIVARLNECMERVAEIEKLELDLSYEICRVPAAFRYDLWEELDATETRIPLERLAASSKNGLYKPRQYHGSGTLLIRMFNIVDATFDVSRQERLQVTRAELADYTVKNGDLLVNRVNSRELVGKSCFVEGLNEPAVFEAMLIRLRPKLSLVDPRLLAWLINSPQFLYDLRGRGKHAIGQSSINQQDLLRSQIPLPSLGRQREIVAKTENLFPLAQSLSSEISNRQDPINSLRQAILRKAFAGEL
jgi:type I restriction enzyme S subunit